MCWSARIVDILSKALLEEQVSVIEIVENYKYSLLIIIVSGLNSHLSHDRGVLDCCMISDWNFGAE